MSKYAMSDVSLARRMGAIMYDILLVFSLVFLIMGVVIALVFDNQAHSNPILFYAITLPTTYLYFAISWTKGRQTLGMKAWQFQVVQRNGRSITHAQALRRFVLAALSLTVFGAGFFYQLWHKNNLAWHDLHSNTRLIKNPPKV